MIPQLPRKNIFLKYALPSIVLLLGLTCLLDRTDIEALIIVKDTPAYLDGDQVLPFIKKSYPIALELTHLPLNTSAPVLVNAIYDREIGKESARDEALSVLQASPFTPDSILKVRLKEIALAVNTEGAMDPRFGQPFPRITFKLLDN